MAWRISSDGRIERLIVFTMVDGGVVVPVGELTFEGRRRRSSVFRYARSWLEREDRRPISAVAAPLRRQAAHSRDYEVILPFYDASPDGWGKGVLNKAYPNQFFGIGEYIAAMGDNRVGDLFFGPDPETGPKRWMPYEPLLDLTDGPDDLEALQAAAMAVDEGRPTRDHLSLLCRSSADLGGARPKARMRESGQDWIAKFRVHEDAFDVPRMEAVCLTLAEAAGIEAPEHKVVEVRGRSVLLVKRFDRAAAGVRHGYMSAATLMGADPYGYATDSSYSEIALSARTAGIQPCERDLFRRLLFNCAVHNTDDHLRNHAFIRVDGTWRVSPVFDVVPNSSRRLVLRPAPGVDPLPEIEVAFESYPSFNLDAPEATEIFDQVVEAFSGLNEAFELHEVSSRDRELVMQAVPFLNRVISSSRSTSG